MISYDEHNTTMLTGSCPCYKDWELYYQIKKECQRECRKAYNTYVESLIDGNNVSKKMWSYIKSKKTDYCGIAPLQQNGTTYTDSKDKATIATQ